MLGGGGGGLVGPAHVAEGYDVDGCFGDFFVGAVGGEEGAECSIGRDAREKEGG